MQSFRSPASYRLLGLSIAVFLIASALLVPNKRRVKRDAPQAPDDTQYNRPREPQTSDDVEIERNTAVAMKLVGASTTSEIKGTKQLPGIVNYFIGDQPQNWKTDIPTF